MQVKRNFLLLVLITLFSINGCKNDESNPVDNTSFTAKGSDYFPIFSGKILNAKVSGSVTEYDSLGRVTDFTQISNEIYSGSIGDPTLIVSWISNPIFGNDNGENKLIGYVSNNNGEIIGFDNKGNKEYVVILPTELTIGKEWVVNPLSPNDEQFKIKLVETLNSFTNSAGKTFQNIINIAINYKDSTGGTENTQWYYGNWYEKMFISGNIYLAKGIGIVGVKINDSEYIEKSNYHYYSNNTYYNYYKKTKASGEMGIIE